LDHKHLLTLFRACISARYTHLEGGASYAVKHDNHTVTILFEKSNGALDWRNNLRFSARPYRDMKEVWYCHRGFLSVFRQVLSKLEELLLDKSIEHFVLVGYSHGAALALLTHEYILFHRPELVGKVEGYGFGCPRVIAGALPDSLRARLYGFTVIRNIDDLVTHLPPRLFGYRHPAKPYLIGRRGKYSRINAHRAEAYDVELSLLAARDTITFT